MKYPGSKWNIAPRLVELIPEHHSYVEPFFGSGAVLFNKPVSDIETINDLDHDVVNIFRCIQEDATGQDIEKPLDTVTTKDRFGLVTIEGVDYQIVDIGLRMLEPRELYGCQGFPDDYIIDHDYTGKTYPRSEQVRRCGNAVCPPIPAALVKANLPELCVAERMPNMRIESEQTGQLRFA